MDLSWFSRGATPDKIRDKLFISGYDGASDAKILRQYGISHILDATGMQQLFPQDFVYHMVTWDDSPDQEVLTQLPSCIEFIEKSMREGTGVLVHCAAGISRSATVVCSYLMKTDNLTFEKALEIVKIGRPICSPNGGFRSQLRLFYDMQFNLQGTTKAHAIHQLRLLKKEMLTNGKITTPLIISNISDQNHLEYRCNKCRTKLFEEHHIVPHEKGMNRFGFVFRNSDQENCSLCSLVPLEWMKGIGSQESGAFQCPGECGTLVGSWSWDFTHCTCGTMLSPALVVNESVCSKTQSKDEKK